jgi:hypothetical protein
VCFSLCLSPHTPPTRQNRCTRSYIAADVASEVCSAHKLPHHYKVRTPSRFDMVFHWLGDYLRLKNSNVPPGFIICIQTQKSFINPQSIAAHFHPAAGSLLIALEPRIISTSSSKTQNLIIRFIYISDWSLCVRRGLEKPLDDPFTSITVQYGKFIIRFWNLNCTRKEVNFVQTSSKVDKHFSIYVRT